MIGLKCELCQHREEYNLKAHLNNDHGITTKQYRSKFPHSKTMTGHSKRTTEYWVYRGLSVEDAVQAVKEFQRLSKIAYMEKKQKSGQSQESAQQDWNKKQKENSPRALEHYLKKGHTLEESKELQREYMSEHSAKSKKFSGKTHSEYSKKLISEGSKANAKRAGRKEMCKRFGKGRIGITSKAERECYKELKKVFPKLEAGVYVDPYIVDMVLDLNIIIEFYGDYWHRNPKRYKADEVYMGIETKQVWDSDKERIDRLKSDSRIVYIIWESSWNKDKQGIIEDIKQLYENKRNRKTEEN